MSAGKLWSCLGLLLAFPVLAAASSFVKGWAFSALWRWFMVPTFGVPVLGVWLAAGLAAMIQLLLPMQYNGDTDKESTRYTAILTPFAKWFFLWLVGYVIHTWVLR